MSVTVLGEPRFTSPIRRTVSDSLRVPEEIVLDPQAPRAAAELLFELAGPRAKLFFDPEQTRAGIVTCGGLCPGLNNGIRSLFLELHHAYGVKDVLGFRGGYQGLDPARGAEPIMLTSALLDNIHKEGGTILGTSRGPVDMACAVDNLIQCGVNILFTIGGDGTQRGGIAGPQDLAKSEDQPLFAVEAQQHSYCAAILGFLDQNRQCHGYAFGIGQICVRRAANCRSVIGKRRYAGFCTAALHVQNMICCNAVQPSAELAPC